MFLNKRANVIIKIKASLIRFFNGTTGSLIVHPDARRATYIRPVSFIEGTSLDLHLIETATWLWRCHLPPARLLQRYLTKTGESSTAPPQRRQETRIIHTARKSMIRCLSPEVLPPAPRVPYLHLEEDPSEPSDSGDDLGGLPFGYHQPDQV